MPKFTIVSTTIGAEGLDVSHGEDILLADDAESFADSVVALLRDTGRRKTLERAASMLAARYDWSVISRRFEDVLARVAQVETPAREAAPRPAPLGA